MDYATSVKCILSFLPREIQVKIRDLCMTCFVMISMGDLTNSEIEACIFVLLALGKIDSNRAERIRERCLH